jgi:hypothetical protein
VLISKEIVRWPTSVKKQTTKLTNSVALVRDRTIPTERPPTIGEVSVNFADGGCCLVSITHSYGRILSFLDRRQTSIMISQYSWTNITPMAWSAEMYLVAFLPRSSNLQFSVLFSFATSRHELFSPARTLRSWVFVCVLCAFFLFLHSLKWDSQPT